MFLGLIGSKCGMTHIYVEGAMIPVTVLHVGGNQIAQIKRTSSDGYDSVQLGYGVSKRHTKPEQGHFKKHGTESVRYLREFRLEEKDLEGLESGAMIDLTALTKGMHVDVSGVSKGRGFSGCVRRHNFKMQRATHGNSISHRAPGSTGQCQDAGRVFKNKKMAGQYGNTSCTSTNLEVVDVHAEEGIVLVKGAVPGHKGSMVVIHKSTRSKG